MKRLYLWLGSVLLVAVGTAVAMWPEQEMVGTRSWEEWSMRLESADPMVRADTIRSIEEMGIQGRPLVPFLVALTRDPHPVTRGRAVLALVTVERSEAHLPVLIRALRDSSTAVRMDAVMGLQLFGKAGVPGLSKALQDPDPTVVIGAAYGLGRAGSEASGAIPLLEKMKRARNYRVAEAVREALAQIEVASDRLETSQELAALDPQPVVASP